MKEEESRKISGSLAIKKPGIVLKGERRWLCDFLKIEYAGSVFTKMLLQRKKFQKFRANRIEKRKIL